MIDPIGTGKSIAQSVVDSLGAGIVHRHRLDSIDTRIVVSGVRGKSTVVRWLHDIFHERGYDTYAKVTGDLPVSIYNGTSERIDRDDQVRLYENERELRANTPVDVAIVENQGIRQYTTRLVNEQFVKPDVIFLTNVREDHLDTLGQDRVTITRELARTIPRGTTVISGEQDPTIRAYLERELDHRGIQVTHVDPPGQSETVPGQECVYGIDEVLDAVGEAPVPPERRTEYLSQFEVSWHEVADGQLYDCSAANDIQSTELIRQSLDPETTIEPILFLRADRRGRTASFLRYLETLSEQDLIECAHVVGTGRRLFARRATFQTETYDPDEVSPMTVLDSALAAGHPVLVMGNTVDEFMDRLQAEIERRITDSPS